MGKKKSNQRANLYRCLPEQIICEPDDNSRHSVPKRPLQELIDSILLHGQLEPVTVRRERNGELRAVFGSRRIAAIARINEAKLAQDPLMVTYQVRNLSDEDAYTANLAENLDRDDLSPIDKAHAIDRLAVAFGRSVTEIAKLFHRSIGWVSQTRRLLDLPADVQRKVHAGEVPATTAYEMLTMSVDQQHRTTAQAVEINGRAATKQNGGSSMRAEPAIEGGPSRPQEEPDSPKPVTTRESVRRAKAEAEGPVPRTRKEILEFWVEVSQSAVSEERAAAELAEAVLKHHGGELTDRQLLNRIVRAVR